MHATKSAGMPASIVSHCCVQYTDQWAWQIMVSSFGYDGVWNNLYVHLQVGSIRLSKHAFSCCCCEHRGSASTHACSNAYGSHATLSLAAVVSAEQVSRSTHAVTHVCADGDSHSVGEQRPHTTTVENPQLSGSPEYSACSSRTHSLGLSAAVTRNNMQSERSVEVEVQQGSPSCVQ